MRWLAFILFTFYSATASAAVISSGGNNGGRWISISGKIEYGDDKLFKDKAENAEDAVVLLASPGGNVIAGIGIGDLIHERHYATIVPSNKGCASICGLIWLGGAKRMAGDHAMIGFHAAYAETNGVAEVSSVANALLGAYYARIGLSDTTIMYLTEAGPRDMRWLTRDDARANDIAFVVLPPDEEPAPEVPPLRTLERRMQEPDAAAQPPPPPQTPSLTLAEAAGAARLTRNFNARFAATGMPGVEVSIDRCYERALELRSWDSAVYCTGLDVLAMLVDSKLAEAARLPATVRNERSAVVSRSDAAASALGFPPDLLRERGSAVALVAASKIDTTEDPAAPVRVEARRDTVVTGRSVARDRSPCDDMASEWGRVDTGLGQFLGSICAATR